MIPFNLPPVLGAEVEYLKKAINKQKLCGDGFFSKQCQTWFEENFDCLKTLMMPSCTHALELAAMLINIQPGDEVIMPSFTFVSTANPFVLRGAKIVFVDIRKDTLNIDETKISNAITKKTKAIVPVHYAGVACEMDAIMEIAAKHNLYVIEDAAQCVMSSYKGRKLGTIGHMGAYSFHETKNYTSGGEGGLLLINDERFINRAEIIREKGTNRSNFLRGQVDKYTWVDIGSSYLPSELQSAYLMSQIENAHVINKRRLEIWDIYYSELKYLEESDRIKLPIIPENCIHNAHMFHIRLINQFERDNFIDYMKGKGISTPFHYVPLHTSPASCNFSKFHGEDLNTTNESSKLVRLPIFFNLTDIDLEKIIVNTKRYFSDI